MASLVQRPNRPTWYIQYYLSGKLRRVSTATESYPIAKEKLRQFESAQARGDALPLASKTPIAAVVSAYVAHIRTIKTAKSAQTDVYYLRDVFGPICDELKINSRKVSEKTKKRPPKKGQDRRRRAPRIEANAFEQIATADISAFIRGQVAARGLAPKTANRYREVLSTLFNWAMTQHGIRMPQDKNPAAAVQRYKVGAPRIRFLKLPEIDQQLDALKEDVKMQAMVATLIYAGLRREELLWLRPEDFIWDAGPYGVIRIHAKTVGGESWEPKTKKNRSVPISSQLKPYLDKWRLKGGRGKWFFPNTAGGRWDPDNFSRDLRAANAAKNLVWTNLDYRHTFGSHLAMRGESLYKIATLMGNSPAIAERHYASLSTESLHGSVEFGPVPVLRNPHQAVSA